MTNAPILFVFWSFAYTIQGPPPPPMGPPPPPGLPIDGFVLLFVLLGLFYGIRKKIILAKYS